MCLSSISQCRLYRNVTLKTPIVSESELSSPSLPFSYVTYIHTTLTSKGFLISYHYKLEIAFRIAKGHLDENGTFIYHLNYSSYFSLPYLNQLLNYYKETLCSSKMVFWMIGELVLSFIHCPPGVNFSYVGEQQTASLVYTYQFLFL